jgi:peroxiredoxin
MSATRRQWLVAGAAATLAAAFAGLGGWFALRHYGLADASDEAVDLLLAQTLPDHAGQPFALASLRGRVVVLNFWATWCPPCVEEMPELAELHREIAPRNALVVGIGVDSASNVAQFAAKSPYPYPLLVAGMGGIELARSFGNRAEALPFTVVIDRRGRIVGTTLGRVRIAKLRANVSALL